MQDVSKDFPHNYDDNNPPKTKPGSLVVPRESLRESVIKSSLLLSPRFGYSAKIHDFAHYNRSRADSSAREWQYPRSSLVYLRELGEGQFGKVILMKAQVRERGGGREGERGTERERGRERERERERKSMYVHNLGPGTEKVSC